MIQYGVVCILLYTCLAFARGAPPSIYGKNVSVDDPWRWDKMGLIDHPACIIDASAQVHHQLVFGKGIIKDLCGARLWVVVFNLSGSAPWLAVSDCLTPH